MFDITASIVLYENEEELLLETINSFLNVPLNIKLLLVDNSSSDRLKDLTRDPRVVYIFNKKNLGFGKAHNIAIKTVLEQTKYHLVLNPDVIIPNGALKDLFVFMESRKDVGLVLPKVLDFDAQIQFVCKRLPAPSDLFIRRFGIPFFRKFFQRKLHLYEMRDKDYNESFEAPSLSGCFMLFRSDALSRIGLFDERFFMYLEDIDISRRVHEKYKTLYYSKTFIYHGHARESYKLNKLLFIHMMSAIRYFNKWGWLEKERRLINKKL